MLDNLIPIPENAETILIIEDHPDTQAILTRQLARSGYNVVWKPDGLTGLDWLETNRPSLVILDFMLPDLNGEEICQRIRKRYSLNVLPVIMLSAMGGDARQRARGLRAGANDFVAKPYHFEELLARIQTHIAMKTESEQAINLLDRYVTRALRRRNQLDMELSDQRSLRQGVVLFADLRGFTRFSATTEIEDVLNLLDNFFEAMMQVIEEHGGIVFDVIGDELLAVFNVPQPLPLAPHLAVQAALEMQALFALLQTGWASRGFKVGLGIGVHQGKVVVGNIGAGGLRRFTVMGHPVNVAARLLSMAIDGEVIISPEIYAEIQLGKTIRIIEEQNVLIRGLEGTQTVYRLRAVE
jgi:class 3 adenylate cyclase